MTLQRAAYIVTTSVGGISRAQIWDASLPLTLGHPLRWILEKTPRGIRARNLESAAIAPKEIPNPILDSEPLEIELTASASDATKLVLKIKPFQKLAPVFHSGIAAAPQGPTEDYTLTAFSCIGDWITRSARVGTEFSAYSQDKVIFTLRQKGPRYHLITLADGLKIGNRALQKGSTLQFDCAELAKSIITFSESRQVWKFSLLKTAAVLDSSQPVAQDPDAEWFKRALQYALVGLGAFAIMTWVWPKPKPSDELIPPQFAKIVLAQPKKVAASEEGGGAAPKKAQKAEDAKLVQAFRAKALRNSINGLLKGGMTKLLSQSDFVMGTEGTAEARRMFDSKSNALQATGAEVGLMNAKNVRVAALGGGSGEGAGGVGYGKGQHAGIQGQGSSHVSLDLGNSSVEEGLTKDEVGEVIHRHLSEVRYCYEAAMLRNPGVEGRLIVNFSIAGSGAVKTSEVKTSTLPDPRLDDCILRRLVTWKFPNPKGGVEVAVSYPFIFKTLGR